MSDTTVVVDGQEPDETTASFEAGVAAATSQQAAAEAAEAAGTAEVATMQAREAAQMAGEATGTAYDAQAGVQQLRDEMGLFMAEMREALARPEEEVPAPEPEEEAEPEAEPEKPKRKRRYGSRSWFGDRAYENE